MLLAFIVSVISIVCVSRTFGQEYVPNNVVTVPPNCPPGQQWINGACRDVWDGKDRNNFLLLNILADSKQIVTVPQNCPNGQQWINGRCRDVWLLLPNNVVTVPPNCPAGQKYINGACRDVWTSILRSEVVDAIVQDIIKKKTKDAMRNIITVPNQCPNGSRPDSLGNCRPIFD